MLLNDLEEKKLLNSYPKFMISNTHYLTIMGSIAYGVSEDTSDFDIYGFCIPPKENIFPHLSGVIPGFGRQINRFEQFQQHHIHDKDALGGKGREYDISVYSIIKYFQLCMENNPNMLDSLFTPHNCILHITNIGNRIRENRKIFLHKGSYFKHKGYAYSQQAKMVSQKREGGRREIVEKYGYDIKFAYHCIRLLNQAEQILLEHDLDLQKNNEQLKSIRRGEWTLEEIKEYFTMKERQLEELYSKSDLRHSPDEESIKNLLLSCLEEHYGSLDKAIERPDKYKDLIFQIKNLVENIN